MEHPVCKNIRSRKHPDQRCSNPATTGDYCGIHSKHPRQFLTKAESAPPPNEIFIPIAPTPSVKRIQKWWRKVSIVTRRRRQGPALFIPEISTNTSDFFSMEDIKNIPRHMLFSYVDTDKMVYAFDVRSISTLIEKNIDTEIQNPYNRQPLSQANIVKAMKFIRWCRKKNIDTRWAPIEPSTPDQRFQLKVTDLFQKIDELGYYTNSQWFIGLDERKLRRLYVELYDIWYHRAGLTNLTRNIIIPSPARPFRYSLRDIIGSRNLDFLRKSNMELLRMFVSAATEKPDRSSGAMYVLTAMTLVNKECAESYPWLYESAMPGIYSAYAHLEVGEIPNNTMTFLNALLNGNNTMFLPMLALPPPAANGDDS
jgi:hypothetical protein